MNARIDMYSPEEVAKSVGVTEATICNWCRTGLINSNNVSDGTDKARYEIDEEEYRYLRDLARKYGPKKVLLYYKKDWKGNVLDASDVDKIYILPEGMYNSGTVANFIGIDKSSVNRNCRTNRIHHETKPCAGGNGAKGCSEYTIPGWEVLYLKSLYDKYGSAPGRGAAMTHYIYDVDKRESKKMNWLLDMGQVKEPEIVESPTVKEELEKASKKAKEILDNIAGVEVNDVDIVDEVRKRREPSDDKLLDDFIKIRDLKKDIDNTEAKLNQMRAEYEQLKEEFIEWL